MLVSVRIESIQGKMDGYLYNLMAYKDRDHPT